MTSQKSAATLAHEFYYRSQYGFIKAPVSMNDGGVEKNRRFAAALCVISGADGEVSKEEMDFILGYCAAKGYPQSIIDDIPRMCKDSESKGLEEGTNEIKELLTMGTLKNTSRQIIYDAIRAASADDLDEKEKTAIQNVARLLKIGDEELKNIHELVVRENMLKEERIKLLFPNGHPCLP